MADVMSVMSFYIIFITRLQIGSNQSLISMYFSIYFHISGFFANFAY